MRVYLVSYTYIKTNFDKPLLFQFVYCPISIIFLIILDAISFLSCIRSWQLSVLGSLKTDYDTKHSITRLLLLVCWGLLLPNINIYPHTYFYSCSLNDNIILLSKLDKQQCVPSTWMPHPHYHFLCSMDHENGGKPLIWH